MRLLRRERFDLLHTHGSVIGVIGRTAALLARTPVVIHQVHGFHHHEHMAAWKRRLFILVERMMAQCTDRLLFQTEADLLECRRRRIAPARKCVWIGNGIDLSRFRPAKRAPNDPPVVLCVARFEPVKNHEMLFEAVRILYERGMRFRLLLAGEGVEQTRWERWVRDRGFADRVRFLGYRDDVPALTAAADVCVLSSIKEGIPRAVMEAAACGRPMVATDVAGNRDALLDGKTGYLVPLGDAAAMAERIERLLRDEPLRRRMGEAGRRHAEQHFDENKVTERILAVYDEMLASPRIESASERPAKESIAR
ncbi:MAG: glycosyltransferase family 1 protein [Planctomycetota bacterium]|nr:MAG: glycosyltransferase family 1 protein [Planctomycetota bacterium]